MNFVKFDELMINFDLVSAIRLRQNKNDGSFRNKDDYPYVADLFTGGNGKPFTIHLTTKMTDAFKRLVASQDLSGGHK
jgi:hypothetical protein